MRFKLKAAVDEYFLSRVSVGKTGVASAAGRDHTIEISRVFPQVTEGRFSIELSFTGDPPDGLRPGQSLDVRLTLGEPAGALLVPNDAWLNDSGGNWIFLLTDDGRGATRRPIRMGRRNNLQVEIVDGLVPGDRVVISTYSRFGTAERLQIHP
jgi:HlyD family secretion protein